MFVPHVVVAPVHAVTVTLLLWFYVGLGPSCLPGMGLLLLQMPLQYLVGKLYAKLRWVVVCVDCTRGGSQSKVPGLLPACLLSQVQECPVY